MSNRRGFASMDRDQVRRIASKGGRSSGGRNERDYDDEESEDSSQEEYDNYDEGDRGSNPNRVRGGQKAAETRRRRGTGFFENMDRDELREMGRRGGQKGGRARGGRQDGYDDDDGEDDYEEEDHGDGDNARGRNPNRVSGGKKAAETRRKRGTGFFENMPREKLSEIGRKGGSRSNRGRQYDDDDEEETPRNKRQRR